MSLDSGKYHRITLGCWFLFSFSTWPTFQQGEDGTGWYKGTPRGGMEGGRGGDLGAWDGLRGGGTAADAIDLHDPVRNRWAASWLWWGSSWRCNHADWGIEEIFESSIENIVCSKWVTRWLRNVIKAIPCLTYPPCQFLKTAYSKNPSINMRLLTFSGMSFWETFVNCLLSMFLHEGGPRQLKKSPNTCSWWSWGGAWEFAAIGGNFLAARFPEVWMVERKNLCWPITLPRHHHHHHHCYQHYHHYPRIINGRGRLSLLFLTHRRCDLSIDARLILSLQLVVGSDLGWNMIVTW